jgi:hypothetical protein
VAHPADLGVVTRLGLLTVPVALVLATSRGGPG